MLIPDYVIFDRRKDLHPSLKKERDADPRTTYPEWSLAIKLASPSPNATRLSTRCPYSSPTLDAATLRSLHYPDMSVDNLRARVTQILKATPTEKLATISTKDVRAQLLQAGDIDKRWLKENKDAVKELIQSVFEAVSAHLVPALPPTADAQVAHAHKKEEVDVDPYPSANGVSNGHASGSYIAEDGANGLAEDEDTKPAVKPKKRAKSKNEISDEQFARQLEMELNGRSRSARSGKAPPKKAPSRTSKAKKKSAEHVDDSDADSDGDRLDDRPKKKRKRTGGGGGAKGGFGKEFILR